MIFFIHHVYVGLPEGLFILFRSIRKGFLFCVLPAYLIDSPAPVAQAISTRGRIGPATRQTPQRMNSVSLKEEALRYHSAGRPGKIKVVPTKPTVTADDLSLAYTPGVAAPCREIQRSSDNAYKYTAKGNLVAVVSNGTAVLGLGNIGALAGKPVMEGKAVLFKRFADIDVFDIEIDSDDADEIARTIELIAPTFGDV